MSCNNNTISARRKAGKLNLYIEQGATFLIPFVYKEDGIPVDLTGVTAAAQFREKVSSLAPVISLTSEPDGGLEIVPLEGKIVMTISAEITKALKAYGGVWDMLLTMADGSKVRILNGRFEVSRGVTR